MNESQKRGGKKKKRRQERKQAKAKKRAPREMHGLVPEADDGLDVAAAVAALDGFGLEEERDEVGVCCFACVDKVLSGVEGGLELDRADEPDDEGAAWRGGFVLSCTGSTWVCRTNMPWCGAHSKYFFS